MKARFLLLFLFVVVALGLITYFSQHHTKLQKIKIGKTEITVEVSATNESRSLGLGGRASLAQNSGMLFVFDQAGLYQFWMKGMKFPLDFIWINNGKVVDLTENVPPERGVRDSQLKIYASKTPIDKVLEVNAGFVKKNNIRIGDLLVKIN